MNSQETRVSEVPIVSFICLMCSVEFYELPCDLLHKDGLCLYMYMVCVCVYIKDTVRHASYDLMVVFV